MKSKKNNLEIKDTSKKPTKDKLMSNSREDSEPDSSLKYDTLSDKIAYWFLIPGDFMCNLFKVKGDKRYMLRLFLNLFIYTKIFGVIAVYIASK